MRYHLRNIKNYITEFGFIPAITLVVKKRLSNTLICFKPKSLLKSVYIRPNSSDFAVLRQIIGKEELKFDLEKSPNTIIDAGANIGLSSVFFANMWPSATILAIEPDEANYEMLELNTKHYPNITCIKCAMWYRRANLNISNPNADFFSYQVHESSDSESGIQGYSVPEILDIMGCRHVDFLKLDIEGAEHHLFSNRHEWLNQVGAVALELHERYSPGVTECILNAFASWRMEYSGEYILLKKTQSNA